MKRRPHAPISFAAFAVALALSACSSQERFLNPDCHSCTVEDQAWEKFPFSDLSGVWRGSVETVRNERTEAKKVKGEERTQVRFLSAEDFFRAKGSSCEALPKNAVVMNGLLWSDAEKAHREFEAFVPSEDGHVSYGRLSFGSLNGKEMCHYRRLGRVMGMNRLGLPTVSFTQEAAFGRTIASTGGVATDVNLEFLRFAPVKKAARGPASALDAERPSLMIRVFKLSTRSAQGRGQWKGSEEQLYRLWRAN